MMPRIHYWQLSPLRMCNYLHRDFHTTLLFYSLTPPTISVEIILNWAMAVSKAVFLINRLQSTVDVITSNWGAHTSAILFIDTSDNVSYKPPHSLIRTPYLLIITSNAITKILGSEIRSLGVR